MAVQPHSSYAPSAASDDLSDYDLVSASVVSLDSSGGGGYLSPSDLVAPYEPPASQIARERFATATLAPPDIQAYVRRSLENSGLHAHADVWERRTVRVYVDGAFDNFTAGHALQLRQAKLAFPSVRLIVGVFADTTLHTHGPSGPERAELVRHCRWVDEVIPDAPELLDVEFLLAHHVDVVAVEEGISLDPTCSETRWRAYETLKALGKTIPTRRTFGLSSRPSSTPASVPIAATALPSPSSHPPATNALLVDITSPMVVEPGTPKSPPSQAFEDGPPLDIFGIGI